VLIYLQPRTSFEELPNEHRCACPEKEYIYPSSPTLRSSLRPSQYENTRTDEAKTDQQ
jgi:hypothetical protein